MPGDPLRARFIAENYLKEAKLINNIRGAAGYTGYYGMKEVTVIGLPLYRRGVLGAGKAELLYTDDRARA